MAKVKIQGNASGTGVITLIAPNTNTDRTVTLPDESITLGGGVDGIVSTANATAITIDSSENVGIGTTVPYTTAKLNVAGLTSTSATAYNATNPPAAGQLDIRSTDAYGTQLGGKLTFSGNTGSGGVALSVYGAIQGVKKNTTINNAGGGLSFSTTINSSGLLTERLEITDDGRGLSQFTAKAWASVSLYGTGPSLDDYHNVSSLTDIQTGVTRINFTNSMSNSNYAAIQQVEFATHTYWNQVGGISSKTTSNYNVTTSSRVDYDFSTIVFGD